MAIPRKLIVTDGLGVYHCTSRCVRRAYLYGYDSFTGKDYNHRKKWMRERMVFLLSIFTVEVLAYALMDNHSHVMVRLRDDLLGKLSDKEIVLRWLNLYPKDNISDNLESKEAQDYINSLLLDKERIETLRKRIGSISWFMKSLNEFIARKANKEDECKGRFWEGRFNCKKVKSDAAVLACAVYIDLNPIRAKKAITPETSEYTSAYERIQAMLNKPLAEPDIWLTPFLDNKTRKGFLPIPTSEYLRLLDQTGRQLVSGKKGSVPHDLEPILVRLGIRPSAWLEATKEIGNGFSYVAGNAEALDAHAKLLNRRWLKGIRFSRQAFM